jgi:PqqD family protein of HPr-rel-A system
MPGGEHQEKRELSSNNVPRRRSGILEIDLGDGLILYDRDSSLVHRLNPSAALIWRLCDGGSSVSELVGDIVEELGVPQQEANLQVGMVLRELERLGLTEDASIGGNEKT